MLTAGFYGARSAAMLQLECCCFRFVTVTGLGNNVLNLLVLLQSQFVGGITSELFLAPIGGWRRLHFVKNFAQASTSFFPYLATCLLKSLEILSTKVRTYYFLSPKARHQLVYIIDKNQQLVFCSCTYLWVGSFLPSSSSGGSPWRLRR